jgi:hypothetical protein
LTGRRGGQRQCTHRNHSMPVGDAVPRRPLAFRLLPSIASAIVTAASVLPTDHNNSSVGTAWNREGSEGKGGAYTRAGVGHPYAGNLWQAPHGPDATLVSHRRRAPPPPSPPPRVSLGAVGLKSTRMRCMLCLKLKKSKQSSSNTYLPCCP